MFPATDEGAQQTLTLTDSKNKHFGIGFIQRGAGPDPNPSHARCGHAIQGPAPANATSGVAVWVQVIAEDESGQPAPSYDGTATVTSTGSATSNGVSMPTTVKFDHGEAMFPVVFTDPSSSAPVTTTLALTDWQHAASHWDVGPNHRRPSPRADPRRPDRASRSAAGRGPQRSAGDGLGGGCGQTQPVLGSTYDGTPTLAISGGCSATLNGTPLPTTVQFTNGKANFSLVFTIASSVTPQNGSVVPMPVPTTLTLTDAKNDLSGSITFGVVPAGRRLRSLFLFPFRLPRRN